MVSRILFSLLLVFGQLGADCVYGAKDKTNFVVLDSNSIVLKGGYGSDILIKTYCYIYSSSDVQILKDDFCDYESAIMYIDGEVCDANQVKKI
ncbi:hypothetical protein [Sulfurimonas xiamenensis]|uniref:Uncharacterized protein n=1 Tax=Sulfurimonas xiamenensis TaxID=2590021 RepID=A0AAJ4A325_9BACT|nr:hypothetical protein [Sulfurimonas xiamenensis]QFR42875.1 hypothetical protein FJR47_02700 [Sulfurimonas xiamenensis]